MKKKQEAAAVAVQDIKVFFYNGFIGIQGKNITSMGMGFVIDVNKEIFQISQEAYDALLPIPRNGGSFAELDCFKADDTTIIFGWMGGPHAIFDPSKMECSRSTEYTLLKEYIMEVEIPQNFKDAVDEAQDANMAKADDSEQES